MRFPVMAAELAMHTERTLQPLRSDQFFAGPGARAGAWRQLLKLAEAWSSGASDRKAYESAFDTLAVTEEFHGYPGSKLLMALRESIAVDNARAALGLTRRVTWAPLKRS